MEEPESGSIGKNTTRDTYKFNTITKTGTAIEFNCNTPTVTSNIISGATTGFNQVAASFAGVNTFDSVATIRTDGCTDAQTRLKPEKQGVPMPAPSR